MNTRYNKLPDVEILEENSGPMKMLYEYYFYLSKGNEFKKLEEENLMQHILGKINPKDLEELDKWEAEKVEQWKREGRLSPDGRLLLKTASEEFLREY